MSRLFLAALPSLLMALFFYWRTWIVDTPPSAQWTLPITGFMFVIMLGSAFLTMFCFPVPKKEIPRHYEVVPQQVVVEATVQSPYRGYSYYYTPTPKKNYFSLLWEKIIAFVRTL